MKSKDVQSKTGLTRKAIEYYEEQGLVMPSRDENGYRNYTQQDIVILVKISLYRKLGLNVFEIKDILMTDNKKEILSNLVREKTIRHDIDEKRLKLLKQLTDNDSLDDIKEELFALEAKESIYNKLSDKFPGYIGQMFFINYLPFIQGRLDTEEQKNAFEDLIKFLDQMKKLPFNEEEKRTIQKAADGISTEMIESVAVSKLKAVRDTKKWTEDNDAQIKYYQAVKNSKEYQSMPIVRILEKMKTFLNESGYYDVVTPLMRKISPEYNEYYIQMMNSNDYFIKKFDT